MKQLTQSSTSTSRTGTKSQASAYSRYLLASASESLACRSSSSIDGKYFEKLLKLPSPKKEKAVVAYLIALSQGIH